MGNLAARLVEGRRFLIRTDYRLVTRGRAAALVTRRAHQPEAC